MSIQVESSTDTQEEVLAAQGGLQVDAVEETSADDSVEDNQEQTEEVAESAQSEQDETNDTEDSDSSEEGEDEESEEDEATKKPKPKRGFKRRIDKLNSKLSAAEEEREYWRQQALAKQSQEPEKESKIQQSDQSDQRPDADNFETHEEYFEALSDWKVEQKLIARDRQSEETRLRAERDKEVNTFRDRVKDFSETVEDFDEVIQDVDDIPMSISVQESILGSDNGPELMYQLAKEPEEYKRICSLSPVNAARAIGRFEAKFQKSEPSKEKPKLTTSNAPTPPKTLGSRSSGKSKKTIYDNDISQREFEKQRMEQLKTKSF